MSNSPTDIERIERMFNKAVWLIGVIWTLTIGTGAFAFFTSFSYLNRLVKNAEEKLDKISKQSENKIELATKNVVKEISTRIDINKLVEEIKHEKIPAIEKELNKTVDKLKERIDNRLLQISNKSALIETKLNYYQSQLDKLIKIQQIANKVRINIYGLALEPTLPRIGHPAQIVASISAPRLEENQILSARLIVNAFGVKHEKDITIFSSNDLDISIPIIIPEKDMKTGINLGEGKYAISLSIVSKDNKILFAQKTTLVQVYSKI